MSLPNPTLFYHSNGKLLLTGEYFVLQGACALAVPSVWGQVLSVEQLKNDCEPQIHWQSFTYTGQLWFETYLQYPNFTPLAANALPEIAEKLQQILQSAQQLNPIFLATELPLVVKTHFEFPADWGLGSSSTLINNVAQWAGVNPYSLQFATFGGSGYDIACAGNDSPILYKKSGNRPLVCPISYKPPFSADLYFVHLGKKQNSRQAIQHFYQNSPLDTGQYIAELDAITQNLTQCNTLPEFEALLNQHEQIVSVALQLSTAKALHFNDFWGSIKSLGAWGGDFVLATSTPGFNTTQAYFKAKGFATVIPYAALIKPLPNPVIEQG